MSTTRPGANARSKRGSGWIQSEGKRVKSGNDYEAGDEDYQGPLVSKAKEGGGAAETKLEKKQEEKKPVVQQVKESQGRMIEVLLNDRLGKKIRVKCNSDDTVGDLKKLTAAQIGSRPEKLRIQKWYTVFKDHITLDDYEVTDGMSLELYYN